MLPPATLRQAPQPAAGDSQQQQQRQQENRNDVEYLYFNPGQHFQ
jgi:hypothetical protein